MKRRDFIKTAAGIWIPNIWIQRAEAQFQPGRSRSFIPQSAGTSYLVSEDFEGAGTPSGWTNTVGSPDYDYATALIGSQSLFIDGTGTSTDAVTPTFSAQSELWLYFVFTYSANPAINLIFASLRDNANADTCYLRAITTAGSIRLYHGSVNTTVTGWSTGTTYHIWIKYTKGTGANGLADLYRSTTDTRPAVTASITNGSGTTDIDKARFQSVSSASLDFVFDKIRISSSEITSSPP